MTGFVVVAITGAVVGLDRLCFQTMISRPIVAAPVLAFLLGQGPVGLIVGSWLELLWIDRLPVGNYVPPDASYLAVIVTGAVILAGPLFLDRRVLIPAALGLLLPLAYAGKGLNIWIFTRNEIYARAASEAAAQGDEGRIARLHLLALGRGVAVITLFITLSAWAGSRLCGWLMPLIPHALGQALTIVYYLFPFMLFAVVFSMARERKDLGLFILAGVVGGVLWCVR